MTKVRSPVRVKRRSAAYWRVTFDNPPVNLFDPDVLRAMQDLTTRLETDDEVKVVVFDSADPEFFMAHLYLLRVDEADGDDPDRSVWHRAASRAGPDAQVSAELEDAAARALRRGAPAVAAAALERAAQLTADPAARGALLLRAAEMEFELGRADLAQRLLVQASPLELGRPERARLALLLEEADADSW
jgi:hypothetical protein